MFGRAEPLDCAIANFKGHRSAWFPLLSACHFAEFDTSVICHVFMHCLGSFLMQDMSPRICFQATKYEIYHEHVAYLHYVYIVTPAQPFDKTACKYSM